MKIYTIGYINSSDDAVYVDIKAETIEAAVKLVKKHYSPYRVFMAREVKCK